MINLFTYLFIFIKQKKKHELVNEFIPADKQQNHNLGNHLQQQHHTNQLEENELSKWKETLGLVLSNRTPKDFEAITSLGDILMRHGWIHAAHIW